jgi:predicted transposase/invertase (TIGR01784 family)
MFKIIICSDEREDYEDHLKWLRLQMSAIKKYEQIAAAEGEASGEAKGRIDEKYEIAKNMLGCDIAVDLVMKITGLTRGEVEKILTNQYN